MFECIFVTKYAVADFSDIAQCGFYVILLTTIWRIFVHFAIGNSLGRYYASGQCSELIKPMILTENENNIQHRWKLNLLKDFYKSNKSILGSKKLETDDATKTLKLHTLTSSLNYTSAQIFDYFEYIINKEKYTKLKHKCSEEFWKSITMTIITFYGLYTVSQFDFLYNVSSLYEYPQIYTNSVLVYYKLSFGYHGHRAIAQFWDNKRKDFWITFFHHLLTIYLIVYSWHYGFMKYGVLLMFCHDNGDLFLSFAKLCVYLKYEKLATISFGFLLVTWPIFRIFIFPQAVIQSIWHFVWIGGCDVGPNLIQIVGLLLVPLHIYWYTLIINSAIKKWKNKLFHHDPRSDSEEKDTKKRN